MDQTIELVPLVCLKCNTPIPASSEEVAWVCQQCGQGMLLYEKHGLVPLQFNFSSAIPPNAVGRPYWVAEGRVELGRATFGSDKGEEQARNFWSQPRRFFVPAYQATLEELLSQATNLLLQAPLLEAGPVTRFEPVIRHIEDVKPAAEFIIMAVEAGRPDNLKEIHFELQLTSPILWVL